MNQGAKSLDDVLSETRSALEVRGFAVVPNAEEAKAEAVATPPILATLDPHYAWATVDSPHLKTRVRLVDDVQAAFETIVNAKYVLLAGRSGIGKTSLFNAAVREWVNKNAAKSWKARYWWSQDFEEEIQWAKRGFVPSCIGNAKVASHLFFDNLRKRVSPLVADTIASVFEKRRDLDLGLWVTTGMTFADIIETYGEPAFRAITENAVVIGEVKP